MSTDQLASAIVPALVTGVRGRTLPEVLGATSNLQLLALAAQALRLDRPAPPASFLVDEELADPRPPLPDAARGALARLVTASGAGLAYEAFHRAIIAAMTAAGFRLHPFDVPHLGGFVERNAERLGAEARAFVQRGAAPDQQQRYFDPAEIDDESWTLASRAEQSRYIEARRLADPEAGRTLVEAVWSGLDVERRVRLIRALRVGLSGDDAAFFERALGDRSGRVKDVAKALIARVPGRAEATQALGEALDHIQPAKGKKGGFEMRPPPSLAEGHADWLVATYSDHGVTALAAGKNVSVDALVEASRRDSVLQSALVVAATGEGRLDVVAAIADFNRWDVQQFLIKTEIPGRDRLSPQVLRDWIDAAVRPAAWDRVRSDYLVDLFDILQGPAPAGLMRAILSLPALQDRSEKSPPLYAEAFALLAVLCPPEVEAEFADLLVDPPNTTAALDYLAFKRLLESNDG